MLVQRSAKRYAQALFELAHEQGQVETVLKSLAGLRGALQESRDFAAFAGDYQIARAKRLQILTSLFSQRLDALTWRFLVFLEGKRRMGLLDGVCGWFLELHDRARGVAKVALDTAFPLEAGQSAALTGEIRRIAGRPVETVTRADLELLGGFRFQIEDKVYDYSVAGQLQALSQRLAGA
jgi:F-type H+-transporting ATPase subunit delta